jgi:Domain of unknown function (DUF1996)/WSC domain
MVAGDPMKRSYGNDKESAAINYACLNFDGPATAETNGFPNRKCSSGLRAQVFFPSCWDGKNLDSPDHKSHMSYPANDHAYGACPPSHPVHFVSLFYEVIFSTDKFDNQWYGNKQPFVWSMGDPTGYGLHGDFFSGWDVDHLQKAIDICTNNSGKVEDCPVFTITPNDVAKGCRIPPSIDEQVSGTLDALPGCNPVQPGPERAVQQTTCSVSNTIGKPQAYFTDLTQTKQWSYVGCGTDSIYARKFTGANTSGDKMTIETCVDFCSGKGFSVAGTEYGRECYCAKSIPSEAAPVPGYMGNCMTPCAGDTAEYCGGSGTISLYQKCTGNCQNVQFGVVGNTTTPATSSKAPVVSSATLPPPSSSKAATSPAAPSSKAPVASPSTSVMANIASTSPNTRVSVASTLTTSSVARPTSTRSSSTVSIAPSGSITRNGYYAGSSSMITTSGSVVSSAVDSEFTSTPDGVTAIHSDATSAGVSPMFSGSPVSQGTAYTVPTSVPKSNVTLPEGWKAAGCYVDPQRPRLFKFWASFSGRKMSSSKCVRYCDKQEFAFAGTENGGQCFCSDDLAEDAELKNDSECSSPCKGAPAEKCGGPARLSVFTMLDAPYGRSRKRDASQGQSSYEAQLA